MTFSGTTGTGPRSGRHATLVSVGYSVLAVLPLFLVSSQAVQLQRDLEFGTAGPGLAVSVCFAVSALAATPLRHVVAEIGSRAGLKLAAGMALAALAVAAGGAWVARRLARVQALA